MLSVPKVKSWHIWPVASYTKNLTG